LNAISGGKPLDTFPEIAFGNGGNLGKAPGRVERGLLPAAKNGGRMPPFGHTLDGAGVSDRPEGRPET
jgi:hypothetical protein